MLQTEEDVYFMHLAFAVFVSVTSGLLAPPNATVWQSILSILVLRLVYRIYYKAYLPLRSEVQIIMISILVWCIGRSLLHDPSQTSSPSSLYHDVVSDLIRKMV